MTLPSPPESSLIRPFLAYALIWLLFLAVPAARAVVLCQFSRLRPDFPQNIAKGLLCGLTLVVSNAAILISIGALSWSRSWQPVWQGMLAALAFAVAVAATEEMIVRGLLLTRLRQFVAAPAAIFVTAVVFAVMHFGRLDYGLSSAMQYLADGLLLGWIAVMTGSIWAGAALHFAKNFGVIVGFGTTRQIVAPLLASASGPTSHALDPLADLVAYTLAVVLAIVLFRTLPSTGKRPR